MCVGWQAKKRVSFYAENSCFAIAFAVWRLKRGGTGELTFFSCAKQTCKHSRGICVFLDLLALGFASLRTNFFAELKEDKEKIKWVLSNPFEPDNFSDKSFLKDGVNSSQLLIEIGPRFALCLFAFLFHLNSACLIFTFLAGQNKFCLPRKADYFEKCNTPSLLENVLCPHNNSPQNTTQKRAPSLTNFNIEVSFAFRLNFSTAFSTNATSICHGIGLTCVSRIEYSTRYLIQFAPSGGGDGHAVLSKQVSGSFHINDSSC